MWQAVVTCAKSARPAAVPQSGHVDQINKTLDDAILIEPTGRAVLNVSLGYPDFDPATRGAKDEDNLSARVRKCCYWKDFMVKGRMAYGREG